MTNRQKHKVIMKGKEGKVKIGKNTISQICYAN
jgi:hypothetical protein